jgi:hypothetical protein
MITGGRHIRQAVALPKTGIEGDNDVEALTRIEKRFPALLSCGSLKKGAGRDPEGVLTGRRSPRPG